MDTAIENNDFETMIKLLKDGQKIDHEYLQYSIDEDNINLFSFLIEHKCFELKDVNSLDIYIKRDGCLFSNEDSTFKADALMYAIYKDNMSLIKGLLELGVRPIEAHLHNANYTMISLFEEYADVAEDLKEVLDYIKIEDCIEANDYVTLKNLIKNGCKVDIYFLEDAMECKDNKVIRIIFKCFSIEQLTKVSILDYVIETNDDWDFNLVKDLLDYGLVPESYLIEMVEQSGCPRMLKIFKKYM